MATAIDTFEMAWAWRWPRRRNTPRTPSCLLRAQAMKPRLYTWSCVRGPTMAGTWYFSAIGAASQPPISEWSVNTGRSNSPASIVIVMSTTWYTCVCTEIAIWRARRSRNTSNSMLRSGFGPPFCSDSCQRRA